MEQKQNRQWRIARHPEGLASVADFAWTESPVSGPGPNQALVRNSLLSLDPTSRSWMRALPTYLPPLSLGDVMRGIGVGTVVESNMPALRAGMPVYGMFGWQDYAIVGPEDLVVPLPEDADIPQTIHLGLFGHIGMTAYFGMLDVARPTPGETIVVSAAAGAVGSLAGQIGKIKGCRVVGIAGSAEKCQWILNDLGFDAAINYREEASLSGALARHCPTGIDVYFDNVGGTTLETALDLMNVGGRVAACGMISGYNETGPGGYVGTGVRNLFQLPLRRVRMEGFLVLDYWSRAAEAVGALADWYREGRLKYRVHVIEGLENAPEAMNMLFDGRNQGKLIVKV